MQKTLILFFILFNYTCYSQKDKQRNFCESNSEKSYFPLDNNFKKVNWRDTFYTETKRQTKTINGKDYIEFLQESPSDDDYSRYFREENGIIYELNNDSGKESIRFSTNFKAGFIWKSVDEKDEYKIISYDGELKTPFCNYQNLLVMDVKLHFGNFTFYYAKGLGFVGATQNGNLIAYLFSLN